MGTSCSACLKEDERNERKAVENSSVPHVQEAIVALCADVKSGQETIPTFEWKYRRYGAIEIGTTGALQLSHALLETSARISVINLSGQGIDDEGAVAVASSLKTNEGLRVETLNLSKNRITDLGAIGVVMALKVYGHLRDVNLEDNVFGSAGFTEVCLWAEHHPSIETLALGAVEELSEQAVVALERVLTSSSTLRSLRITGNNKGFTATSLRNFFESVVGKEVALETLTLIRCVAVSATGEPCAMSAPMRSLGRLLKNDMCKLKRIELQLPLGSKGAELLAASLPTSTLETLAVPWCEIGSEGIAAFAAAIKQNCSVRRLDLSHQRGVPDSMRTNESTLTNLAFSLRTNTHLEVLNIIELGMPNESAKAFAEVLESRALPLREFRHNLVKDNALATRLGAAVRRSESPKRKVIAERLRPDDEAFTVEDDTVAHPELFDGEIEIEF